MGPSYTKILFVLIVVTASKLGGIRGTDARNNTCCNCATIQGHVSAAVGAFQEETQRQLQQLLGAVSDLAELLDNAAGFPKDCSEVLARGVNVSGVYVIQPRDKQGAIRVYCDMETDGGGWTVFQRRQDGSVDFYRGWESYRWGFGDLRGEFWLGNDNLHRLTAQGNYKLRVDLTDFNDSSAYAVYDAFTVANGSDNYRLRVGTYSGTAGDSITERHNNRPFSTRDRDNDESVIRHCAQLRNGAWWYGACYHSNLNGIYLMGDADNRDPRAVVWYHWKGWYYSLKRTEMKIKKIN